MFLNFIHDGQRYLEDVAAAIAAVPENRACMSGPDLLSNDRSLYADVTSPYEVLTRHQGCRANSAQLASFLNSECDLECIFQFAVSGTFGDFPQDAPGTGGVCVNSYLFWNYRANGHGDGPDWTDVLRLIGAHP